MPLTLKSGSTKKFKLFVLSLSVVFIHVYFYFLLNHINVIYNWFSIRFCCSLRLGSHMSRLRQVKRCMIVNWGYPDTQKGLFPRLSKQVANLSCYLWKLFFFSENKTLDQHFGASPKKYFCASFCLFLLFYVLMPNTRKSIFWPAMGVCITQTLVEINSRRVKKLMLRWDQIQFYCLRKKQFVMIDILGSYFFGRVNKAIWSYWFGQVK